MSENILSSKRIVFTVVVLIILISVSLVKANILSYNKIKIMENTFSQHDLLDFDQKIMLLMKLGHFPSLSACIIKNNSVVWSKGYGFCDLKNAKSASNKTIYMAGSITKTFTSTAIMQFYENGYLDLNDDVNKYLPFNLRNPNYPDEKITIRMLLSHQSSLSERLSFIKNFFFIPHSYKWLREYLVPGGCIYDPKVWSERHPGEDFEYTNIGFEILGYICEKISNQSFNEYCKENIFIPLDMKNTSTHINDFNINDLAIPYIWRLNRYISLPNYEIGCSAAAGIRTSALDLSHFLIAHMNGGEYNGTKILEEENINLMHTIQYPNNTDPSFNYGLGWMIDYSDGEKFVGHRGGVFGGSAYMFYHVSDTTGVIFFLNQRRAFWIIPNIFEEMAFQCIQLALFEKGNKS